MARCKGSVGGGDDADISELNERFSGTLIMTLNWRRDSDTSEPPDAAVRPRMREINSSPQHRCESRELEKFARSGLNPQGCDCRPSRLLEKRQTHREQERCIAMPPDSMRVFSM